MGPGGRQNTGELARAQAAAAGPPHGSQPLRAAGAALAEVSGVCACNFYFRFERQERGQDFPHPAAGGRGTPQTHFHLGHEPLPQAGGFRTRLRAHGQAGEDLLSDAGLGSSAYICAFHRPCHQAALLLPALYRKSDPAGVWVYRHAHPHSYSRERLRIFNAEGAENQQIYSMVLKTELGTGDLRVSRSWRSRFLSALSALMGSKARTRSGRAHTAGGAAQPDRAPYARAAATGQT